MKALQFSRNLVSGLSLALMAMVYPSQAQEKTSSKTKINIRITEELDGRSKEIVREYSLSDLNHEQREELIEQILDSIDQKRGAKRASIDSSEMAKNKNRMEERRKLHVNRRIFGPEEEDSFVYHWENMERDLERISGDIENRMMHLKRDFSPKARALMKEMESWGERFENRIGDIGKDEVSTASMVKGLSIHPNKPHNGVINLRFQTLHKGDVHIRITDTKGKEVGERVIKDFEGEFVGQVPIKKNTHGTIFVMVTMGEDGSVRRMVIP
ncbi:hypothetical protein [Dyadobacter tibetensis]|uniref:hypothetical protein n=1 Tax=Dyadobacter tibetensis TaxID=1211851 RepID=UPI00046EB0F6|nr:hypothetical protein [Dyadobacter tibetensis]